MTKFDGTAVESRTKRPRLFPTGKEMRKNMEIFKRTGVHPDLAGSQANSVPPLPERDMNRPHVFMDLQLGMESLGRLVLEVFEDQAPLAARQLLNRCREGTRETLHNTQVHRLITDQGMFFGKSHGNAALKVRRYSRLHHNHAGVVSLSADGTEVAITFDKALSLDKDYQVVARLHKGVELLEKVNSVAVNRDDLPVQRITIASCGFSDHEGAHESLEEAAEREARQKETPAQAAARVEAESQEVRSAVRAAVQTGLGQKRRRDQDAQNVSSNGAVKKGGMLADVLGDLSDDEDDDDAEAHHEEHS